MLTDDQLVMVGEAARIAHVSPDTVRRWADDGLLVAFRTSARVRLFNRADVEHIAAERASRASQQRRRRRPVGPMPPAAFPLAEAAQRLRRRPGRPRLTEAEKRRRAE